MNEELIATIAKILVFPAMLLACYCVAPKETQEHIKNTYFKCKKK